MTTTDFGSYLILSRNEVQLFCSRGLLKRMRKKLKNTVFELKLNGTIQKAIDNYFDKR